jgi:hypothetical protein
MVQPEACELRTKRGRSRDGSTQGGDCGFVVAGCETALDDKHVADDVGAT